MYFFVASTFVIFSLPHAFVLILFSQRTASYELTCRSSLYLNKPDNVLNPPLFLSLAWSVVNVFHFLFTFFFCFHCFTTSLYIYICMHVCMNVCMYIGYFLVPNTVHLKSCFFFQSVHSCW